MFTEIDSAASIGYHRTPRHPLKRTYYEGLYYFACLEVSFNLDLNPDS